MCTLSENLDVLCYTVVIITISHAHSNQAHTITVGSPQKARGCTPHGHALSIELGMKRQSSRLQELQPCVEAGGGQGPAHLAASLTTHLLVVVLTVQDFNLSLSWESLFKA